MPIRDTNVYPMLAAGQDQGIRNELVRREVQQDNELRGLLAQYAMPGSSPEEKEAAFDMLTAADPRAAAQVMQVEQAQRAIELDEQLRSATEGHGMANYILTAADPVIALEILDDDGAVRQEAAAMGFDTKDPEDVREIARVLEARYGMVAGLGDPDRAPPAAIREMQMLGYEMTPEGFARYNQDRGDRGQDPWGEIQAMLTIEQLRQQNAERDREAAAAAETERRDRLTRESNVAHGLEQGVKIVENAELLQGSFLEAGVPYARQRRAISGVLSALQGATGIDNTERAALNDAYDTMTKNMNDQLISLMESSTNMGQATDAKLRQYQSSLANPEIGLGAIMDIEAGILETYLELADQEGFVVDDREAIESEIGRMRQWSRARPDPVIDTPGLTRAAREMIMNISTMTAAQLDAIEIDENMPAEVLRAAANRARALEQEARGLIDNARGQ